MKKHLFKLLFLFLSGLYCSGQTSLHTEITRIDLPKDYLLKDGMAKEIIVTRKVNPGQNYSYLETLEYTFPEKSSIKLNRYKDSELETTKLFTIDSLGRILKNTERFKHKSLGWSTSKFETVYNDSGKDLRVLHGDGSLNFTMRVLLDDNDNPIQIRTLDPNNRTIALSTADYDYDNNTFIYTVYNQDGLVVLNTTDPFKKNYEINRNEFGDLTEYYWPTSTSDIKYLIEYKYDDRGNWIRMKKIQINGKKKTTTEITNRKIKYSKN